MPQHRFVNLERVMDHARMLSNQSNVHTMVLMNPKDSRETRRAKGLQPAGFFIAIQGSEKVASRMAARKLGNRWPAVVAVLNEDLWWSMDVKLGLKVDDFTDWNNSESY